MPIYEFKCDSCGNVTEELRKSGEDKPPECKECGGEMRRKYSSSVNLEFKGPGFHATDYPKPYDDFKGSAGSDSEKY